MQKNNVDLTKLFWFYKNVNKSILNNFENIFIITREGRNSLESFGITDDVTLMDYKTPIIWKEYDNSVKVYHIQKS